MAENLMERIIGTDDIKVGTEVEVTGNSNGGHNYQIGAIGVVVQVNPNPYGNGIAGVILRINGNNGNWCQITDISPIKIDKRSKDDLIKEIGLVVELLNEMPEEEFVNSDRKKLAKKYKSFKFLKLFNNAKTEYEKLKILEDLL